MVIVHTRGVLPFVQRKRLWEKYRAKCRKQRPSSNQSEIVTGSQVCMKNSPMYQPGAIGKSIIHIISILVFILIGLCFFFRFYSLSRRSQDGSIAKLCLEFERHMHL